MAKEVEKLGSAKRFGPRYGRTPKYKLAKIEAIQHGVHVCPYCHAPKVKRLSAGLWQCRKCNAKFTGKAYSLKKIILKEEKEEEPTEEKIEETEEAVEESIEEDSAEESTEEA